MNRYFLCIARLIALLLLVKTADAAIIHFESGDAGELPGTAQATGSGALATIHGNLTSGLGFHDVDLFAINIVDKTIFSATVVSGGTTVFDTYL